MLISHVWFDFKKILFSSRGLLEMSVEYTYYLDKKQF